MSSYKKLAGYLQYLFMRGLGLVLYQGMHCVLVEGEGGKFGMNKISIAHKEKYVSFLSLYFIF